MTADPDPPPWAAELLARQAEHEAALTVGRRVKVRLSAECQTHFDPAWLAADGMHGTIWDDIRSPRHAWEVQHPDRASAAMLTGHWWAVALDTPWKYEHGLGVRGILLAASEIELLPARPDDATP